MEAGVWLKADVQVSSLITVTCHGLILSAPGQGRCQNKNTSESDIDTYKYLS